MTSGLLVSTYTVLRILNVSDFSAYKQLLTDPEIRELTGTQSSIPTDDQIKGWLSSRESAEERYDWAILDKADNEFVGEIVLSEIDDQNHSASLRIGMFQRRDKGLGSDAIEKVLEFSFNYLKLHRVELEVYEFNPRAIHVYEKLGFKREGIRRDILKLNNKYFSAIQLSILKDEYNESRKLQCESLI